MQTGTGGCISSYKGDQIVKQNRTACLLSGQVIRHGHHVSFLSPLKMGSVAHKMNEVCFYGIE